MHIYIYIYNRIVENCDKKQMHMLPYLNIYVYEKYMETQKSNMYGYSHKEKHYQCHIVDIVLTLCASIFLTVSCSLTFSNVSMAMVVFMSWDGEHGNSVSRLSVAMGSDSVTITIGSCVFSTGSAMVSEPHFRHHVFFSSMRAWIFPRLKLYGEKI